MAGTMITNGGTHPASKWAEVSADQLIKIAPGAASAALRFKASVIEVLTKVYGAAQKGEVLELDADGDGRLGSPLDPGEYADDGLAAVVAAAKGTPYEAHFAQEEVRAGWRNEISTRVVSIMDIERSWHADRNPTDTAKAYHLARAEHGGRDAHMLIDRYREEKPALAPEKKAKGK